MQNYKRVVHGRGRDLLCILTCLLGGSLVIARLSHFLGKSCEVVLLEQHLRHHQASRQPSFVPTFRKRGDLATIMQEEGGFKVGVELGVQRGHFSDKILTKWTDVVRYILVDTWKHLEHYEDIANVDNSRQEQNYQATLKRLQKYKDKGVTIEVCRNFTTACVHNYADEEFDFIYVDARHDFKGVSLDLNEWWPKLRKGGLMAGHDYVEQSEVGEQDWTVNYDGTIDETGTVVKGAVDAFAKEHHLPISVSYREQNWNTWAVRKPWFKE